MSKNTQALTDSLLSKSFIAVVFSFSGWLLLEMWFLLMHASVRAQMAGGVLGSILVYLSLRHSSKYRIGRVEDDALRPSGRPDFRGPDIGYALFLFGIGNLIGTFVVNGGTFFLAALIVPLCFAPWSRIPFCRNHLFSACIVMSAGIASALYIGRHSIDLMFPAIASWIFWTCTALVLLSKAEKLWQNQRSAKRVASAFQSHPFTD